MAQNSTAFVVQPQHYANLDLVMKLFELLDLTTNSKCLVIKEDQQPDLSKIFTEEDIACAILLAHGSLIDLRFSPSNSQIHNAWLNLKPPINGLLAYTCYSAHILSQSAWLPVAYDWIGATRELTFSFDDIFLFQWKKLFLKIINNYSENLDSEVYLKIIEGYVHEGLRELNNVPGKELYRALSLWNFEGLTCKKLFKI